MLENLIPLIVLFFVILDPLASFVVFLVATKNKSAHEKHTIAAIAVVIAGIVSLAFLIFGQDLLVLFNTNIANFKVAGGVILSILGVQMALGHPLADLDKVKNDSGRAVAAIIGTPLLTGPAAISAIIVSVKEYGHMQTGLAVAIVLAFTAVLFYQASRISKFTGKTAIQVTSTILGLITLAWGVGFIRAGLGF
ncbi:MAG: MarC family protein [Candidatus Micrarchaeota archaeon]